MRFAQYLAVTFVSALSIFVLLRGWGTFDPRKPNGWNRFFKTQSEQQQQPADHGPLPTHEADSLGDLYLLGVGKADITGYVLVHGSKTKLRGRII